MTLTAIKKEIQGHILDGMARSLWVHAYADWADRWHEQYAEAGDTDAEEPQRPEPGGDWEDVVPETPDAAYVAARALTKLYRASEQLSLPDLFELAMTVDQAEFQWETPAMREELAAKDLPTQGDVADEFGFELANMAIGAGSWFDHHKQTRLGARFDPQVPTFECAYDGEELVWSGREGHGQVQAKYAGSDQPVEITKLGKITVINPNDRNFYDHSYVYSFGAYGDTLLLAYASGPDSALDECIDWLVENAPGHIIDDQVEEEYQRYKAEGMSAEEAWQEAEVDTISGGNAGNHLNASEVFIVAEDPDRDRLYEIAGLGDAPSPNPAGLTAKGERMYEQIRAGYAAVGNQRAKEIAARTVLSRAKHGGRGLVKAKRRRNPEMTRADAINVIQRLGELDTEYGWRPTSRADATRKLVHWHEEALEAVRAGVKRMSVFASVPGDWFEAIVDAFDVLGPRSADQTYLSYVFRRNPPGRIDRDQARRRRKA